MPADSLPRADQSPERAPAGGSERDRRCRAIVESAVDFAMIATDRDGRITDWNPGAERIFGWSAAEMPGQPLDRLFTPEDRAAGRPGAEMRRALESGRGNDERWHIRKDGNRFWASGEMMPLRDDDGALLGFLKILRDRTERRRADEAFRQARSLNTLILDSSRDCIVVLDLDGHTQFVSPGGIESMEMSDVDAILGLSWLRVWQGADHDAAVAAVAAARAGGVGRFQGFCPTHKGAPKWWDVAISPLPGLDGKPERLVSVGRDVTDSVQARERLALSEQSLRLSTEAARIGTWDLDLATDVLTWSDRTKAMFGISPSMPCDLADFYAGLHPDDREAITEAFASALDPARRATYDVEYRTVGKEDGKTRWVAARGQGLFDSAGRCVRAIGTAIDVSARKAAEERLRTSEADLRELNATLEARVEERTRERDRAWKNSRDLLAIFDGRGVFLAVNDAWTTILGWRADEVVGRSHLAFIHPDDQSPSEGALATARVEELPAFENRCRHKDGGWRWFSWVATPDEGLIYASGRHVTAEKEAAAELAATQEKLRQSQKMEAVGQLTGGVAHDFNNLLTGIIGSLELLQSRLAQGRLGDADRYVGAAQGAARRAATLTQRLLAFSRQQTLDPRPTGINRLVADMEELIRRTIGPAIELEVVGAGGLWPAMVDRNQLENALLNLCINARDAMPDGGRLTIETANKWLDERAAAERELPAGQYVSLCVTDTGAGMTPEVAARAFDPFFTTKKFGEGTGLGLSMIYGFVRQSGGQVRIYSELGGGATITLYLPRHPGEADESNEVAATQRIVGARDGETVLVVDDEPTVRMLIAEVLAEAGYTAIEAADGAAGLAVLRSDARIDLLVTDVGLPGGMNGRQVADAGRAARPDLKVLFVTGYAENAAIGNGHLDAGMQVLTKPFAMQSLAGKIRDMIGG